MRSGKNLAVVCLTACSLLGVHILTKPAFAQSRSVDIQRYCRENQQELTGRSDWSSIRAYPRNVRDAFSWQCEFRRAEETKTKGTDLQTACQQQYPNVRPLLRALFRNRADAYSWYCEQRLPQ